MLEVLVAFTVLAISLGMLFQLFSTSVQGVLHSEHYSRALIIAESRLALLGRDEPLEPGEKTGVEAEIYHWRLEVIPYLEEEEDTSPAQQQIKPYQVTVHVGWDESEGRYPVELTTLRIGYEL